MREPRYSKAEQKARMRQFEHWVKRARRDWRCGIAVIIMSYGDYLELDGVAQRKKREGKKARRR